jgi:hypothetical protein
MLERRREEGWERERKRMTSALRRAKYAILK